jgi:hypothetical protein
MRFDIRADRQDATKSSEEEMNNYYPTNTRVKYQGDFWTVLDHAEFVTIVNERTGRRIEVMADLLEVCR